MAAKNGLITTDTLGSSTQNRRYLKACRNTCQTRAALIAMNQRSRARLV